MLICSGSMSVEESMFGTGRGQIWLDSLHCTGEEANITDCQHDGWGITNCAHHEDVGVVCKSNLTDIIQGTLPATNLV